MTATTPQTQTPPAHVGMFQLLNGAFITGAIACLASLGVPDLVESGAKSAEELAAQLGADPRALYRLMLCRTAQRYDAQLARLCDDARPGVA